MLVEPDPIQIAPAYQAAVIVAHPDDETLWSGGMILAHPPDCLLFGTDSPWSDAAEALACLRGLGLPSGVLKKLEGENAARIFRLEP